MYPLTTITDINNIIIYICVIVAYLLFFFWVIKGIMKKFSKLEPPTLSIYDQMMDVFKGTLDTSFTHYLRDFYLLKSDSVNPTTIPSLIAYYFNKGAYQESVKHKLGPKLYIHFVHRLLIGEDIPTNNKLVAVEVIARKLNRLKECGCLLGLVEDNGEVIVTLERERYTVIIVGYISPYSFEHTIEKKLVSYAKK